MSIPTFTGGSTSNREPSWWWSQKMAVRRSPLKGLCLLWSRSPIRWQYSDSRIDAYQWLKATYRLRGRQAHLLFCHHQSGSWMNWLDQM